MCLLVLAWNAHPRYRLIVAANRDEYHDRPAAPLARWDDVPHLIGGRDLRAGGTWLALDERRRFGIITNFRDLQRPQPDGPSRGELIPTYLSESHGPGAYCAQLAPRAASYAGFNLLLADATELRYATNRTEPFSRALQPGIHGLSNHSLDTPWPKLVRVREKFAGWLGTAAPSSLDQLFNILGDREPATADASVPAGLPPELARALSAPFVLHPQYGTRCSTIVLLEASGALYVVERRFDPRGASIGESRFELGAHDWP